MYLEITEEDGGQLIRWKRDVKDLLAEQVSLVF
jgi:hypothetical protein